VFQGEVIVVVVVVQEIFSYFRARNRHICISVLHGQTQALPTFLIHGGNFFDRGLLSLLLLLLLLFWFCCCCCY
jgi:hypothetical protein